jgi:uncharacterized protein (TIGR02145 family)
MFPKNLKNLTFFNCLIFPKRINMKSLNYVLILIVMMFSLTTVKSQVPDNLTGSGFFAVKYTKDKVWDVQRNPAYPMAGQDWMLFGLKGALGSDGKAIDWGRAGNNYLMFSLEVDNSRGSNSLLDDVNRNNSKYIVSLKLFDSNGSLVKIVSRWGKFVGLGSQGFLYEVEGRFGTFFSARIASPSAMIKYKPDFLQVTKMSELISRSEPAKADETPKAGGETSFFSAKYTRNQVWDAQRAPAFPIAGMDWKLSGLKGALDARGSAVDWGTGRYLMFVQEVDNSNGPFSLTDDVNRIGTKHNISLQLFESNGTLVKVVSKWGKIIGIGTQGFMYEEEGRYGTFFSIRELSPNTVVTYKPSIKIATKFSELGNGTDNSQQAGSAAINTISKPNDQFNGNRTILPPVPSPETGILDLFQTKFYKNQVWEVTGVPDELKNGETLNLTVKGPAIVSGKEGNPKVDWGKNGDRYIMFYVSKGQSFAQIIDDIKNDGPTLISASLHERNGTKVPEGGVAHCGHLIGLGSKGVVYSIDEVDQYFNLFFSANPVKPDEEISYKPILANVTKLSELHKGGVVTQLDQLKAALNQSGGLSNLQFNPKLSYGTMTDQSGNTYKTIKIGNQTWMAENLRVTKYRNGESINIVNLDKEWSEKLTSGACCSYNNTMNKNDLAAYGLLYNGAAVTDPRNIAPAGWHVPTDAEWKTLITFLGGEGSAGAKMKEAGTSHWLSPNTGATNESGFTAIPGGERGYEEGDFKAQGAVVGYWSSKKVDENIAWLIYLRNEDGNCKLENNPIQLGYSVRLVKD